MVGRPVADLALVSCHLGAGASLAAVRGGRSVGLDALVFTGGVGEGSARVRADTVAELSFLGLSVDAERNRTLEVGVDADVTGPGATAMTLVIAAREDLEIARQVRSVVG